MQGFTLNNISDCYVGSNQASAIYLGSTLIWSTTPPPPHDYSQDYLTVEFYNTSLSHRIQYADKGGTIYYNFPDIDTNWSAITGGHLDTGYSKVRLKGNLVPETTDPAGTGTNYGIGTIRIRDIGSGNGISFVYGNIMSLLYGDNFINQTSLSGYDYAFAHLFEDNMIYDAKNLILPNDTTIGCYYDMFFYNPYLVYAPILNAQILNEVSYEGMFNGCASLNYIKCLATDISAPSCTYHWLNNVSSTGTFVKDANTTWRTGASGIPSGWTIQDYHDYSHDYLTFEALESGNITWKTIGTSSPAKTISYSINNGAWTSISSSSSGTNISVSAGDKVRFKGNESSYATSNNVYSGFENQSGAKFNIYGNIMSLIYGDNFIGQTSFNGGTYNLCSIFKKSCAVSAENLILPATTLTNHCYRAMFSNAILLEKAPALPATTLAEYCYYYMFENTKITTAPALPATTLAVYCYADIFRGCTLLTTAPALPATTLAERCYQEMFRGCSSLAIAPALPATTLAGWCYSNMFRDCTSLTTAPALPATTLADSCYQYMFQVCSSLTTAPELPATTLVHNCYQYMFLNCTSLNYIKCLATNPSGYTTNWVQNVAASGTFVKDANTTWTTGNSGIPYGWTTQNA